MNIMIKEKQRLHLAYKLKIYLTLGKIMKFSVYSLLLACIMMTSSLSWLNFKESNNARKLNIMYKLN